MKKLALVVLLLAAAARPAAAQQLHAYTNPDSSAAHAAATGWLERVDAGDWQAALGEAAPFLGDIAGSPASFGDFVTRARARYPVGPERDVVEWQPRYVAAGAPPGNYAALVLASPTGTRETVVVVRTPQGWRVAMYLLAGPSR